MRRRPHTRRLLLTPLLASASWTALVAAVPPQAQAAEFAAKLEASCCNHEVLESGATEKQYITVSNTGTTTWGAPGVDSIDVGPDKSGTPKGEFTAPGWTTVDNEPRASVGVSHEVAPHSSYKFVFEVKAPTVSKQTQFVEHFGLAVDGAGEPTWMKGADATLEYTVVPAQPPTVSVTPSTTSVAAGGSFTVNASATSVASVNRVVISFAGTSFTSTVPRNPEVAADEQTTWNPSTTFSAAGVGPGPQTVVATAYDDAGLSATSTATVQVQPPSTPSAPPPPSVLSPVRMYLAGLTVPEHPNELHLTRVVILGTKPGEHLSISCENCHGASRLGTLLARGSEVTFRPHHLLVTGRSKLLVYVVDAGSYGRYKEYSINVRHVSTSPRAQGCLAPGTRSRTACPG
jgi:hypothetical protein